MLTFAGTEDKQSTCFKFIGSNNNQTSISLITGKAVGTVSLITSSCNDGGLDCCSFYSGPSDATLLAFCESYESCGSIAYDSSSNGFGGYSSGESCGSIASTGSFSSGSSFSGGCSYSC